MRYHETLYQHSLPDGKVLVVEAVHCNGAMESVEASVYADDTLQDRVMDTAYLWARE